MIRKIIKQKIFQNNSTETVAGAALVISVAGILSRLLGLLRDRILASQFGAGDTLDTYYAAFRLPDFLYNLLVAGALSAAFVPVFSALLSEEKKEKAWELASAVITFLILMIAVLSLGFIIFAPKIISLIVPGFSPEKMTETVLLTRIIFLSPLFLSVSAVFGGMLVSFKSFLAYSLAPIMYNLGIIVGVVFFVPILGTSGLAWGVVLGAFSHAVIQYFAVKFFGYRYAFSARGVLLNSEARQVLKLMIPRSLGMAVSQINLLIITFFASTLASGSLAIFNFANNLQSVPLGLFGISFSIAAFPHLSSLAARQKIADFRRVFSRTFRRILFFVLPFSALIFVLRAEIVRLVLGAGKFNWEDTRLTLGVLGFLSLSLFAQSLVPLLSRSFYAFRDTKTPFYTAIISEMLNIFLVIVLIEKYQVMGLAIAFSVAALINLFLLFFQLKKKMGYLDEGRIARSFLKISAASFLTALIAYATRYAANFFVDLKTFWEVFFQFTAAAGMGLAGFLAACHYLDVEEFYDFRRSILIRFFGSEKEALREQEGIN